MTNCQSELECLILYIPCIVLKIGQRIDTLGNIFHASRVEKLKICAGIMRYLLNSFLHENVILPIKKFFDCQMFCVFHSEVNLLTRYFFYEA